MKSDGATSGCAVGWENQRNRVGSDAWPGTRLEKETPLAGRRASDAITGGVN